MPSKIVVGIDPGTQTGIAVWDCQSQAFAAVQSVAIHRALLSVLSLHEGSDVLPPGHAFIVLEDARKRRWFGNSGKERWQGAGSIKRDCRLWESYLQDNAIPHLFVAPASNRTKTTQEQFRRTTGWEGRTNEHGRDAGMLVYGFTLAQAITTVMRHEQIKLRPGIKRRRA
jgi:hypothetical protein